MQQPRDITKGNARPRGRGREADREAEAEALGQSISRQMCSTWDEGCMTGRGG